MGPMLLLLLFEEGHIAWNFFASHVLDDVEAGCQLPVKRQVDAYQAAVPEEPGVVPGRHPL